MTVYLSNKIRNFSIWLIMLIVVLYDTNLTSASPGNALPYQWYDVILQDIISNGIAQIAVPLFMMISGFLLFLNTGNDVFAYRHKLRSRIKSLLLPYLIWSLGWLIVLGVLQTIPQSARFFNGHRVAEMQLLQLLDTIFLHPVPYQLWFVRNLLFFVILSPLFYLIYRKIGRTYLVLSAILWFSPIPNTEYWVSSNLFFNCGAMFALFPSWQRFVPDKRYGLIWCVVWLLVLVWHAWLRLRFPDDLESWWMLMIFKAAIAIGCVAAWLLYDQILAGDSAQGHRRLWSRLANCAFFIFALHEPLLMIFKKIFFILFPSPYVYGLAYLGAIICCLAACLGLAAVSERIWAKGFAVITGGRSRRGDCYGGKFC